MKFNFFICLAVFFIFVPNPGLFLFSIEETTIIKSGNGNTDEHISTEKKVVVDLLHFSNPFDSDEDDN